MSLATDIVSAIIGFSMVIGAAIWNEHRINSLKENINNLVVENTMLSTSLEEQNKFNAELIKINNNLLLLSKSNSTIEVEKKVFVNKIREIKVTNANQINDLQQELDAQWENLP